MTTTDTRTDSGLESPLQERSGRDDPTASTNGLVRPKRPAGTRPRPRGVSLALRALVPLAALGLWWLVTGTGWVRHQLLVSPWEVVMTFGNMFRTENLAYQIGVSLARAGVGLVIGASAGLVLGAVAGLYRLGEELVDAPMQMLRTVPFLAVVPLFILWLGIGETPKIVLIALATAFPVYLNTSNGVRNVDRRVVEAMRAYGMKKAQLTREVVLPLALPQIFTGLRFSMGVSVLALIAAEQINAKAGIGYLLNQAESYQQVNVLLVCVFVYCAFGLIADLIVRLLERLAIPWRHGVAAR
ncbi:MAG TPA: ABC transporter permease [Acidimicrobiales bacterium]|jgi:sulfonate transport system permease protein